MRNVVCHHRCGEFSASESVACQARVEGASGTVCLCRAGPGVVMPSMENYGASFHGRYAQDGHRIGPCVSRSFTFVRCSIDSGESGRLLPPDLVLIDNITNAFALVGCIKDHAVTVLHRPACSFSSPQRSFIVAFQISSSRLFKLCMSFPLWVLPVASITQEL